MWNVNKMKNEVKLYNKLYRFNDDKEYKCRLKMDIRMRYNYNIADV